MLFKGKKANIGVTLIIGIVLFEIGMYFFIYAANNDDTIDQTIGSTSTMGASIDNNYTSSSELSVLNVGHWYDGFNIAVFNLPWWVNIFYVTFLGILLALGVYSLIRGLS